VTGSSSRKDVETMLQLVYLRFTQPRADAAAVATQATNQKQIMLSRSRANPGSAALNDALQAALYQNHVRARPTSAETVDQWNLDTSLAFYKDRFADASNFTFVLVGSFDLATIRPLVERYLGSLPSTHRQETWKDVGKRYATGIVEQRVEKGQEPLSQVRLVFTGPIQWNQTQRLAIRALAPVLRTRLVGLSGGELIGATGLSVSSSWRGIPRPEYELRISFSCDPLRADGLVKRVFQEITEFQANGPTLQELGDEKAALQVEFEKNLKNNAYFADQIYLYYQSGDDPARLLVFSDYIQKLDAAQLREAARTYVNMSNYVKVTLLPEKK
jgi:zinc protease